MIGRVVHFGRRNALGLVAIGIALSGTAYAGVIVPNNSVGTQQLKKAAVTGPKLANAAVTAAKVKNRSLTGAQIKPGSLTGTQIAAATLGVVPKASHATAATSATTALSANKLQGKTAAEFVPASRIVTSGWKTLTDCGANCATNVTVMDTPGYLIRGGCQGNGGTGAWAWLQAFPHDTSHDYFEAVSHSHYSAGQAPFFFEQSSAPSSSAQISEARFQFVSSAGAPLEGTVTVISNSPSAHQCAFDGIAIMG